MIQNAGRTIGWLGQHLGRLGAQRPGCQEEHSSDRRQFPGREFHSTILQARLPANERCKRGFPGSAVLGVLLSQRIGCGKAYATGIVARIRKILDLFPDCADSPIHKRLSTKELKLGEASSVCYHFPSASELPAKKQPHVSP
jgi:hypothetical protein